MPLLDEQTLTISEAARWLPKFNGKPVATTTVWRWGTKGYNGIKLEIGRIGRRCFTTKEAINRFIEAIGRGGKVAPTGSRRRKQIADAHRGARAKGLR